MISVDAPLDVIRPEPLPMWLEYWRRDEPARWLCGGYGSGKTTLGVWEAWINATQHHPGYTGIVAAPSFALLYQAWFTEWRKWFGVFSGAWELKRDSKRGDEIQLANGSTILLRSTSVPWSNEGVNAGWLVFDEASREPQHDSYRILRGRLRRGYPGRRRSVTLTGPPSTKAHWTAKEFGVGPGGLFAGHDRVWSSETTAVVRARTRDNPTLEADYEANLRKSPGATTAWCRRFLDAEFGAAEHAVWPQWSSLIHLVDDDSLADRKWRKVVCGVDWGWTHPGVMLVCAETGDGELFVLHEEVHKETIVAKLAPHGRGWCDIAIDLVKKWNVTEFHCDPSQPGNMSVLSLAVRGMARVYPANNSVAEGIRRVGARLERKQLRVSSSCRQLAAEIESYEWKRTLKGEVTEDPVDINDDTCDALRYGESALRRAA